MDSSHICNIRHSIYVDFYNPEYFSSKQRIFKAVSHTTAPTRFPGDIAMPKHDRNVSGSCKYISPIIIQNRYYLSQNKALKASSYINGASKLRDM